MWDESLAASSIILWQLLHLIMKRWIYFGVGHQRGREGKFSFLSQRTAGITKVTSLPKEAFAHDVVCNSSILIFHLFSSSQSWHKYSPVHCRCCAQLFSNRDDFTDCLFKWSCKKFNITDHPENYLQSCWLSPHSHRLSCGSHPPYTQLSLCGCWYGATLLIAAH